MKDELITTLFLWTFIRPTPPIGSLGWGDERQWDGGWRGHWPRIIELQLSRIHIELSISKMVHRPKGMTVLVLRVPS